MRYASSAMNTVEQTVSTASATMSCARIESRAAYSRISRQRRCTWPAVRWPAGAGAISNNAKTLGESCTRLWKKKRARHVIRARDAGESPLLRRFAQRDLQIHFALAAIDRDLHGVA